MGRLYDIYRYAPEVAVDVLSLRRRVQDVDLPALYEPSHYYYEPVPKAPPRSINFVYGYLTADIALLVGPSCEVFEAQDARKWFNEMTTDDPRVWATRGARRVGWHEYVPPERAAGESPLRYSVPNDIAHIQESLARLSVDDLQANVEAAFEQVEVISDLRQAETSLDRLRDTVAPRLLPALKQFYDAAWEAGEIVVYVLR